MTTFEVTRNGITFDLTEVQKALVQVHGLIAYRDAFESELNMQYWPDRKVSPLSKHVQEVLDSLLNFRYGSDLPDDDEGTN